MPDYNTYVGARYVPLIMGQWDNTKAYEPLSIVLNAGNSYTSRQFVPVGAALTDTDYWVMTGSFDGNVAALQVQVNDHETRLDNVEADVTAIENSMARKRTWIFLSDSYGLSPATNTAWPRQTRDLTGVTAFISAVSGGSFANTVRYLTALQNIDSVITDKEAITDILIGGGHNDSVKTIAEIEQGQREFATYVRATYPNAKIHLAALALNRDPNVHSNYNLVSIPAYKNAHSIDNLYSYIEHSNGLLHNYALLTDGLHPDINGAKVIAEGLADWIMCGQVSHKENSPVQFTIPRSGINTTQDLLTLQLNELDYVQLLILGGINITFPAQAITSYFEIASFANVESCVKGYIGTYCSWTAPAMCMKDDGSFWTPPFSFIIRDGTLQAKSVLPGLYTSLRTEHLVVTIPKAYC